MIIFICLAQNIFNVDENFVHRRKIATLTYRSGPEWSDRFGRNRIQDPNIRLPRIDGAEFEIEDYIRHQVRVNLFFINVNQFFFNSDIICVCYSFRLKYVVWEGNLTIDDAVVKF